MRRELKNGGNPDAYLASHVHHSDWRVVIGARLPACAAGKRRGFVPARAATEHRSGVVGRGFCEQQYGANEAYRFVATQSLCPLSKAAADEDPRFRWRRSI